MIVSRNGQTPQIHPTAKIAGSAQIVGNVTIGEYSFIDYNVVIESSGPPIDIADHVNVFAGSVAAGHRVHDGRPSNSSSQSG